MASFTINVFNSLAPRGKRIIVTGMLEQVDFKHTVDGEVVWILRLATNFNGANGLPIDPVYITGVTESSLTEEIRKAVSLISSLVDWNDVEEDGRPPFVTEISPKPWDTQVPITSIVSVRVKDSFPTTGIDPSTIKLRVNGIDVTSQIKVGGADNDYTVVWIPEIKTSS